MLPGEAAIIQQLFEAGLECFHLRKLEVEEQAIRELLDAIPAEYHPRIALHRYHHLAHEYNIQRLHFSESHRWNVDETLWWPLREKGYMFSTSVHELTTLNSISMLFSYTFFSPVFDSISKQQYRGVTTEGFYLHTERKRVPVIALGGIDESNIKRVAAMNFDGAAVLGTIWNEPANAVKNFKLLQKVGLLQKGGSPSR